MVEELAVSGAYTAKSLYGARGWVAHHNTDLWRASAPIDGPNSGMWPLGGAWLLQNLWEHYLFTGDEKYLKKIYPAMKGAAEFFLDTLVEEPTHKWLVTSPSLSPENKHPQYRHRGGADDGPGDCARSLRQLHPGIGDPECEQGISRTAWQNQRAAGAVSNRQGRPASGMA
jgi:hypothetical protein